MDVSSKLVQSLERELHDGIERGIFPSAVAGIRIGDQEPAICSAGQEPAAIFDLASLTKVTATLPAVLLAVQSGKADLHDPVAKWVPEFVSPADTRREQVTLFHLLTHTSGLPAWKPFFIKLKGRDAYVSAICSEPLVADPGSQVIYSDLGFMLLGFILERIWDAELEQVISSQIMKPLGLSRTGYKPGSKAGHIVPTEEGNLFEKNMAFQYLEQLQNGQLPEGAFGLERTDIESFGWRGTVICGTVHDCNAFYGLNGVSGHAGLFSDITDVFRYMEIWRSGEFISDELRMAATRPQAVSGTASRGLGWEMYSDGIFGHTGFTGTSVWHDPAHRFTCIVLTNRVHPFVRSGIQEWRQQFRERLLFSLTS